MRTLDEAIDEEMERDPSFGYELKLAEAELRLAEQIAAVRESRRLTQRALGERTGLAQSAIARYERAGRTPTIETLWKLATALQSTFVIGPEFSLAIMPKHGKLKSIRCEADIPAFTNEDEEAGFWSTHYLTAEFLRSHPGRAHTRFQEARRRAAAAGRVQDTSG